MKTTKEFYELRERFERSIEKMPIYIGSKIEREEKDSKNFYTNSLVNSLFIAYMAGYADGKFNYQ